MTRQQFLELLRKATQETLALTRRYVADPLPGACAYRFKTLPAMQVGPALDAEEIADVCWQSGAVPEWITIVVASVEDGRTIFDLTCSHNYIDPTTTEWRERWASVGQPTRDLLPFTLRLPVLPKGWRIQAGGLPDMARSVAEHGKFSLSKASSIRNPR